MKRFLALSLTILLLSSGMTFAQEGEAADQDIADSPVAEVAVDPVADIFNALSALNGVESKSNPYGFLYVPAGDRSAMWINKIDEDQLIIITYTFADDDSVLTETMSAGNNISEMLLIRDYTNPKAVAMSMVYSHVRMEQTLSVPKLTEEQALLFASDFLTNPSDENFLEKLMAADSIKLDKFNIKFPIQKGSKGDAVKVVQRKLISLECLAGKADGDFGNKSKAAVEKFQTDNDMEVTGALDLSGFIKLMGG
jgi:hypothetical protein